MRKPLKEKTELCLTGRGGEKRFTLTGVLGMGSGCITYSAVSEAGIPGVIKECCPWNTNRGNDGEVIWKRDAQEAKARFERSYRVQLEIMQKPDLINKGAFVSDELYSANATLYSVIEAKNCVSYSKLENESLKNILLTARSITAAAEAYHKYGWLLLDLKPDNVMLYPETRQIAILVDFDGIVKASEVKDGSAEITYSCDFAAPEVQQNRREEIGFASDLYSIGAIIFSKLFGRCPGVLDGIFERQWSTAGTVLEGGVDPGITKRLFALLHRTLSANPGSRYSCAFELAAELDKLICMLDRGAPYVISNSRGTLSDFFGREAELEAIREGLTKQGRVFIQGFRGMGKSTLAKKYIEEFGRDYDAALFLRYDESLKTTLDKVTVFNLSSETEPSEALRAALARQKVLLVIDNFDVPVDGDPGLSEFFHLGADMIFTTRTDFSGTKLKSAFLEVKPLEKPVLREMFEYLSEAKIEDEAAFDEIVSLTEGHTYFMSLLANYLRASGKSLGAVSDKLTAGIAGFENSEKVKSEKDDSLRNTTVYAAIGEMFDMSGIAGAKARVLCDLWLLRVFLLTRDNIRALFAFGEKYSAAACNDAFNELTDLGWICSDASETGTVYYLHPIVQELTERNLAPCISQCIEVRRFMRMYVRGKSEFMKLLGAEDDPDKESRRAAVSYINSVTDFLASLMSDKRNFHYVRGSLGGKRERCRLKGLIAKESTREAIDRLPKLYGKLWLGRIPLMLLVFVGTLLLDLTGWLSGAPDGMSAAEYLGILLLPANRHYFYTRLILDALTATAIIFLAVLLVESASVIAGSAFGLRETVMQPLKDAKRRLLRLTGWKTQFDRNVETLFDTDYPWEALIRATALRPDELLQDPKLMPPNLKRK